MTEQNALEGIVDVALEVVSPLVAAAEDELTLTALLAQMGWSTPAVDLADLADAVTTLVDALEALRTGLSFESLEDLKTTLESLTGATTSLVDFAAGLAAAAGAGAADPALVAEVTAALAVDLLQHLTLLYIGRHPAVYSALELLGLIDDRPVTALSTGGSPPLLARAPVQRPALALDALGQLLSDPAAHLRARLGVQQLADETTAQQVLEDVFGPVLELVVMAGGSGVVGLGGVEPDQPGPDDAAARRRATLILPLPSFPVGGEPVNTWLSVTVELVPAGSPSTSGDAGPGVQLTPYGTLQTTVTLPGSRLSLEVAGDIGSAYFPAGGTPVLRGGTEGVTITVAFEKVSPQAGAPAFALGADTARLTISGLTAGVAVRFGRPDSPELDLEVEGAVERARFVLAPGEGDGFLATVLPPDGLAVDFDLGLGWSNRRGVFFTGAAGLEADLPLNLNVAGVITIDILHLALRVKDHAIIRTSVSASATLNLGPFVVSIQRLGLNGDLTYPAGGGNLGAINLAPAFKPPTGLGLAINTPAVSGGGFLEFDEDAGRYSGVFELTIVNTVSVKVIGIITTKLADGSPGFALVIIITAEGFTPIQLGMGFALIGIGGLLALNRTIDVDVVRGGLDSGVLDSVLFVKDPVANAPRILATIDRIFPLAPDRLLIGPLAEISWGTPPLVKIRLALLLQIPQPIKVVLLAAISVALPDAKEPVVELHVDAIGVLDFGRGELALDASLHDSRLLEFTLTGDMALRLNWGAAPTFLLSVGGFHPKFIPPAGLRPLNRLALTLTDGSNPRIRFETYLAVTSNTIQMGARVNVFAEYGGFGIDGGGGFDALVQWSPFAVDVSFAAWVRIFGPTGTLLAAQVAIDVTGPEPWHVTGVAEVSFLTLSAKIPVDFTIGEKAGPPTIETVDVADWLWKEVGQRASWQDVLPADIAPGVTLAPAIADAGGQPSVLVLHPQSTLTLRQKVVPLATSISRVGARLPTDGTRSYHLDVTAPAGVRVDALNELFAPGQYRDETEDAKLSGAAFVPMAAGISLHPVAAAAAATDGVLATDLVFETRDVTERGTPATPGPAMAADASSALDDAPAPPWGVDRAQRAVAWSVVPS